MARAIFGDELVGGVFGGRDRETVTERRMQITHRRLDAHSFRAVHSEAEIGAVSRADGLRRCVEIDNTEIGSTNQIEGLPGPAGFLSPLRLFALACAAPARVEDPAVV